MRKILAGLLGMVLAMSVMLGLSTSATAEVYIDCMLWEEFDPPCWRYNEAKIKSGGRPALLREEPTTPGTPRQVFTYEGTHEYGVEPNVTRADVWTLWTVWPVYDNGALLGYETDTYPWDDVEQLRLQSQHYTWCDIYGGDPQYGMVIVHCI